MMKRVGMLLKLENSYFIRNKLLIMIPVLYGIFTVMGVLMATMDGKASSFEVNMFGILNMFSQLSHLGFAFILLNAFAREHNSHTYFWLKKHLFQEKERILAKYLFYILVICGSSLLYFAGVAVVLKMVLFPNAIVSWAKLGTAILVTMASLLYTTVLQLYFGYLGKSFLKNVSKWVVFWLSISLLNGVLPVVGGYLSPFDVASV